MILISGSPPNKAEDFTPSNQEFHTQSFVALKKGETEVQRLPESCLPAGPLPAGGTENAFCTCLITALCTLVLLTLGTESTSQVNAWFKLSSRVKSGGVNSSLPIAVSPWTCSGTRVAERAGRSPLPSGIDPGRPAMDDASQDWRQPAFPEKPTCPHSTLCPKLCKTGTPKKDLSVPCCSDVFMANYSVAVLADGQF